MLATPLVYRSRRREAFKTPDSGAGNNPLLYLAPNPYFRDFALAGSGPPSLGT